jgi:nucleoside-diphosphate-sugar epimerase
MLEHLNKAPLMPARVVIIGAGGFVGGAIAGRLKASGVETLVLTRRELDLLAASAAAKLESLLKVDDSVVMVSAVAPAKNVSMLMQNLTMAQAVCAALAAAPVQHLVYISSDAVYADDANPVTEQSYCAPSTLHGMMHAARELMLKSSTLAPVAMLRPTLIYGAADPHGGYGPNRFRRQAERGEDIPLFGEGEEQRDHVSVDDVAELARLILFHRSQGALNAATGVATSFNQIAHIIARQFGNRVQVKELPRTVPRPHLVHRFFEISACHRAFPEFHFERLEEGLARAMREAAGKA